MFEYMISTKLYMYIGGVHNNNLGDINLTFIAVVFILKCRENDIQWRF